MNIEVSTRLKNLMIDFVMMIANIIVLTIYETIEWLIEKVSPKNIDNQNNPEEIESDMMVKKVKIVNISSYTADLIKNKVFSEYIDNLFKGAEVMYGNLSIPIEIDFSTRLGIKERRTIYILINDSNTKKITKLINLKVLSGLKIITGSTPKLLTIEKIFARNNVITHPIVGQVEDKTYKVRLVKMLSDKDKEILKERGLDDKIETVKRKEFCHYFLDRELNFGTGQFIISNNNQSFIDYQNTESNVIDVIESWLNIIKSKNNMINIETIGERLKHAENFSAESSPIGLESIEYYRNGNIYFRNKQIIKLKYDLNRIIESYEKCLLVNY